jgi:Na+-translocating ferredoxin:NAD+ oxidoreductase RnfC subunit
MKRLGVTEYDHPPEFASVNIRPKTVEIPLTQHTGVPAKPIVRVGQQVKAGECVGEIPDGQLGARVHASIDGVVRNVGAAIVIGE